MKKTFFLILCLGFTLGATARDIFRISWRGRCYSHGANGRIVATPYSEREIIAKAAQDNGLDARTLALAYVVGEENIEVVDASGATVAEIFQLEYRPTAVTTDDGSQVIRQAFIYNEQHDQDNLHNTPIGSIFGTQVARHDLNGNLIRFSYRGTFQMAIPEEDKVYSGSFAIGKRINDLTGQ